MDKLTKEERSRNMSRIRSKNTEPELLVRRFFTSKGLRYRIHYKLLGKPDVVFPSNKIAIFIHGCFWHGHNCKISHIPKSNTEFWLKKIDTNKNRDINIASELKKINWKVLIFWECEIPGKINNLYNKVLRLISN